MAIPKIVDADTMNRPAGVTGVMSPKPTVVSVVSPKYLCAMAWRSTKVNSLVDFHTVKYSASKKSEICAFAPDSAA